MTEESPYYFDERAATIAVSFCENLLQHTRGEWAGERFALQPWQAKVLRDLFGWKRRADGTRRYRTAYIEIPRKNGKSTMSAAIALVLLFADGEPGAEVYSAAADREQANIVFDEAKRMVEASSVLAKRSTVYRRSITVSGTSSSYKVLSADAPTKHGLNASGVIFDELHAQAGRELWDVLTTSTGARRQPLVVALTTAGFDRNSICWEQHEYAKRIEKGIIADDSFYSAIFAADDDDDWTKEETWRKANPSIGVTIKLDYLATEAQRALSSPAYQNTFRRLHLNQWTQQDTRWLDIRAWDKCSTMPSLKLLDNAVCYGGLDLASTSDLAAFVLCFPNEPGEAEHYVWLPFFWLPEENLVERSRRDRVPYEVWAREGLLTLTPGNVIDYGRITSDIIKLSQRYNIGDIAFDRWGATQMSQELDGAGIEMVGFGQGFASMSHPTRELMRVVLDGKLSHGGHKMLRWMADNLVVSTDPAGNVKPNKEKSREKIDGVVAGIMALDRAIRGTIGRSVYDARGVRTV